MSTQQLITIDRVFQTSALMNHNLIEVLKNWLTGVN